MGILTYLNAHAYLYLLIGITITLIVIFIVKKIKRNKDFSYEHQPLKPYNTYREERLNIAQNYLKDEKPDYPQSIKKEIDEFEEYNQRLKDRFGENTSKETLIDEPKVKKSKFIWIAVALFVIFLVIAGLFVYLVKEDKLKSLTNLVCEGSNLSCPDPAPCPACNPQPCPNPIVNIINNGTTECDCGYANSS